MPTIKQAEKWIKSYTATNNGKEATIHGGCEELANEFEAFLNDPKAERFELWELWDDYHTQFPYMCKTNSAFKRIMGSCDDASLSDISSSWHIVVKWKGYFWDGYGKQTTKQIIKNFDKCPNPHWFRV